MKILVNTTSNAKGGSIQVAKSLIDEFGHFDEHDFFVVLSASMADIIDVNGYPSNMQFVKLPYRPAQRLKQGRSPSADLMKFEEHFKPDVVVTTSGPSYWRPKKPHLMGFNIPHCIYLDSPFFDFERYPVRRLKWLLKSKVIRHFARNDADAWVVQTDDVNQRLRKWLGRDRVHTVPNTVSSVYTELAKKTDVGIATNAEDGFTILVLSAWYAHKNLEIIDEVVDVLKKAQFGRFRFIVTLLDEQYRRLVSRRNRDFVDNVGPQRPDDCPYLYLNSDIVFLPSLLECFSANYVEAMALQRPILTSDLDFARGVCAEAAVYFNPTDAVEAANRIRQMRSDPALRSHLVDCGKAQLKRYGDARNRATSFISICENLVSSTRSV